MVILPTERKSDDGLDSSLSRARSGQQLGESCAVRVQSTESGHLTGGSGRQGHWFKGCSEDRQPLCPTFPSGWTCHCWAVFVTQRGPTLMVYELKSVHRKVCWPEESEENMSVCIPAGPVPHLHRPYHWQMPLLYALGFRPGSWNPLSLGHPFWTSEPPESLHPKCWLYF